MENRRECCEKLYNRYRELVEKTQIIARKVERGGKINNIPHVAAEDMEEKHKIREELYECLEFLSSKQLKELYNDDDVRIADAAVNIIAKRKIENNYEL